jgi:hypothetical protein
VPEVSSRWLSLPLLPALAPTAKKAPALQATVVVAADVSGPAPGIYAPNASDVALTVQELAAAAPCASANSAGASNPCLRLTEFTSTILRQ